MASEKKLDCVILGLLSHEELTGYEIKKRMDTTMRFLWSASFGSIYPTLSQLVEQGLATRRSAGGPRGREIYTITDSGRERLDQWLSSPDNSDILRSETLLKLFLSGSEEPEQTIERIEAFRRKIGSELPGLLEKRRILRNAPDTSDHRHYLLTVEFGIKAYMACLDWCDEAVRMMEGE